jgi:hypothetical protein
MKNVAKEARKDAFEAAAASMAYGTGAGIRRRHIESAVMYKEDRIPGYAAAFNRELAKVDMTKAVKSAKRTGKTRDVGAITSKNVKALARGDKNGMSAPLVIAIVVAGVAHQTGYDKKALEYSKRKTNDVRAWLKRKL